MTRLLLLLTLITASLSPAFAADNELTGTLLIANRSGGSVSLIDLATRTEIARLPIGPVIPHEMAASPDGRWAVTGEYGSGNNPGRHLVVIDIPAAEIVRRIDMGPNTRPHSIVFLRDSRHVITTMERSEEIALVDIIDGEVLRTWPTGGQDSHMVRLAPDDSRAFVAARGSGTLSAIWLNADRPSTVISTGARAEGIAVSPDGSQVWVANQGDRTISIVDTDTMDVIETIEGIATNRIEFLPDGTAVIPGGTSPDTGARLVTFYDGETLEVTRQLEVPASAAFGTGIRLLAANGLLFLADSALSEISAFNPDAGNDLDHITNNTDNPDGIAWSTQRMTILGD